MLQAKVEEESERFTPDENWEQGSEFHLVLPGSHVQESRSPWDGCSRLYGSGRDALRALILHGRETRSWKRLLVPAYFCQEVLGNLQSTGVALHVYEDGPGNPVPDFSILDLRPGDAILYVNFFGLRSGRTMPAFHQPGVELIEDHTHDPWSPWAFERNADWCVASLRKTLPLPDGGVLWSPRAYDLPQLSRLTKERSAASLERLAGMLLKKLYLEGKKGSKDVFRRLAISGEGHMADGPVSGISEWALALMENLPVNEWQRRRKRNHGLLVEALQDLPWGKIMMPEDAARCTPFSLIILCDSAQRRADVFRRLVALNIYPAILWPLEAPIVDGIAGGFLDLSRRLISIHCDMRYGRKDLQRIASALKSI
jgi:hypothetical protein